MSDEIVDVNATSGEKQDKDGLITPDASVVETFDDADCSEVMKRRAEIQNTIPEYPKEWQEESSRNIVDEDDEDENLKVNISLKEQEMKKLVKKYKRYMRSNIRAIQNL